MQEIFINKKFKIKSIVLNCVFHFLLFLTIYNPGFRFFNSLALVFFISFIVVLYNLRTYFLFLQNRYMLTWIFILFSCLIWSFSVELTANHVLLRDAFSDFKSLRKRYWFEIVFLFFYTILVSSSIVILIKKLGWNLSSLMRGFINISILSSLISILMFFVAPIKKFIFNSVVNLDYYFAGENELFDSFLYLRLNGIGSELTFGYSLFQGLALTFVLYLSLNYRSRLIYFAPFILFSILVNARVGIIIPIVYLIFDFRRLVFFKKSFVKLGSFIFFVTILLGHIYSNPENLEILELIITAGFSSDSIIPHQNALLGSHLFLPDNFGGILYGEGNYVFGNDKLDNNSDIGYINIIHFGGIIFQLMLMALYFYFMLIETNKGGVSKVLIYSIIFSMLLIQIKGNVFGLNGLTKAIIIIFLFLITERRDHKIINS